MWSSSRIGCKVGFVLGGHRHSSLSPARQAEAAAVHKKIAYPLDDLSLSDYCTPPETLSMFSSVLSCINLCSIVLVLSRRWTSMPPKGPLQLQDVHRVSESEEEVPCFVPPEAEVMAQKSPMLLHS